jgi:hypothetical protein
MRGKLRDKHSVTKRDYFKRDGGERRRSTKRDNRTDWLQHQLEDEDEALMEDEGELKDEDEEDIPPPQK